MSHLTRTMVEQFFELEKESARGVLRKEMDLAMDTIFKQMKRKLMMLVESGPGANETGHGQAHLGETIDREQQLYESLNDTSLIPSTSTSYPIHDNTSNQFQVDQSDFDEPISANITQLLQTQIELSSDNDNLSDNLNEEDYVLSIHQEHEQLLFTNSNDINLIPSTSTDSNVDLNVSDQLDTIVVKEEIHESNELLMVNENMSTETVNEQDQIPNVSQQEDDEIVVKNELGEIVNTIESDVLIPTSSTQSPSNDIDDNSASNHNDEDEDCDCNECATDFCVKKEVINDQREVADNVDENGDESDSRPCKRARLENEQAPATNQPKQKQFITISLKCPHCSKMLIDKEALNDHLKSDHSIEKYRCLYRDCNRSFVSQLFLRGHLRTVHPTQPNVMWPCGLCSGYFRGNKCLVEHYLAQHQEGVFQCSYAECQFVGQLPLTVFAHYRNSHTQYVCQYPGCSKHLKSPRRLEEHERIHRDAKPFRCKWTDCKFAGCTKRPLVQHVRIKHLMKVAKQIPRAKISFDPHDYIEVIEELL